MFITPIPGFYDFLQSGPSLPTWYSKSMSAEDMALKNAMQQQRIVEWLGLFLDKETEIAKVVSDLGGYDVSAVLAKVTALETGQGDLATKIAKNTTDITALKTASTAAVARLTAIEGKFPQINADVASAKSDAEAALASLDEVLERVDELETSVEALSTSVGNLSTSVTTATTKVADLDTRVGNAEQDIDSAVATVSGYNSRLTAVETDTDSLGDRVEQAETTVSTAAGQISSFNTRVSDVEAKAELNETAIENFNAELETVTTTANDAKAKADDASTVANGIGSRVTTVENSQVTLENTVGGFQQSIEDANSLAQSASTAAGSAVTQVTQVQNDLATNTGKISELDGRVSSAEGTVGAFDSRISTVEASNTDLTGKLNSLTGIGIVNNVGVNVLAPVEDTNSAQLNITVSKASSDPELEPTVNEYPVSVFSSDGSVSVNVTSDPVGAVTGFDLKAAGGGGTFAPGQAVIAKDVDSGVDYIIPVPVRGVSADTTFKFKRTTRNSPVILEDPRTFYFVTDDQTGANGGLYLWREWKASDINAFTNYDLLGWSGRPSTWTGDTDQVGVLVPVSGQLNNPGGAYISDLEIRENETQIFGRANFAFAMSPTADELHTAPYVESLTMPVHSDDSPLRVYVKSRYVTDGWGSDYTDFFMVTTLVDQTSFALSAKVFITDQGYTEVKAANPDYAGLQVRLSLIEEDPTF